MEKTFTYDKLPQNVEELKALSDLTDEYEVASLVVLVLAAYEHDREEMIKMYDYLNGPTEVSKYQMQFMDDRLKGKEYVARSYFNGTSPQNNYTPDLPYSVTVRDNPYSYDQQGYVTLFITSSGADSDRKVQLRKKGDQYFLWECYLWPDIRIPVKDDPWA